MKIYFTASISQKQQYGEYYTKIINYLEAQGHKVIHEHITDVSMEDKRLYDDEKRKKHYKNVVKWIAEADLTIAEVSYPSTLNVGHEVALALDKGKSVIGLYYKGKESTFFEGNQSEKFVYESYTDETLIETLQSALEYAQNQSDTRFNFFISPKHVNFLDSVSKKSRIPKSVYLRELIENDIKNNPEFAE